MISTNLGLDLYFHPQAISFDGITSCCKQFTSITIAYRWQLAKHSTEIEHYMGAAFNRLSMMPQLFKSYTYSLCSQINENYDQTPFLYACLFDLWHRVLLHAIQAGKSNHYTHQFLAQLQQLYQQNEVHPMLKELIKNAMAEVRKN